MKYFEKRLSEIEEKIRRLLTEIKRKEKLDRHLSNLDERIEVAFGELKGLKMIVEKERADILHFAETDWFAWFYDILGDRDRQLEKEYQEFLLAKLRYETASAQIDLLHFEKKVVKRITLNIEKKEKEIKDLLERKEKLLLLYKDNKIAQRIVVINQNIRNYKAELKELKEAVKEGVKAVNQINILILELEKIKLWGFNKNKKEREYGGKENDSTLKKVNFIHNGEHLVAKADFYLQNFVSELKDVYPNEKVDYEKPVEIFKNFLELFFYNLITDWIVQQDIKYSVSMLSDFNDNIIYLLKIMTSQIKEFENFVKIEENERKDLLMGK